MNIKGKGWNIKNIAIEIVKTLLMLFVISLVVNYIRKPDIREDIYALTLKDIKNQTVNFSNYKDKPLLVNFWGTWCPICKVEAPNIESLSKDYNVLTIAVNSGSNEKIKNFLKEHQLTYRVINDSNGALAKKFNIEVYPTTLIYNSKGELSFTEVGYSTTLGLKARLEL